MGKRSRRLERKEKRMDRGGKKVTGILSSAAGGFGFVNTDEGEVFIPPSAMEGALDGDTVEVEITYEKDERGPVGRISAILNRSREFMVCQMTDSHTAQPLNRNIPQTLKVSGSLKGAKSGDWVNLRLLQNGSKHTEALRGSVEEKLEKVGTVYGDLLAVGREFDMPGPYSPEWEQASLKLEPAECPGRVDLTSLFSVTIDPKDAKDFDDAISIEDISSKEWRIGVHIADVAAYIHPGSKFDKEARKRGFSSYIPGMFRPMLPRPLTSKISLVAGKESLAHTVLLRVRKRDGAVISAERMFSTIKVDARLNYDEVQDAIDGHVPETWTPELKNAISILTKAASKMRIHRKKTELFLELDTAEIRIFVDENYRIQGMENRRQRDSDKLVEECMLAANSAVAGEVSLKPVAGLYRIHAEPDSEKLNEFSLFVSTILKKMPGDLSNRKICCEFLENLPDDHRRNVITNAFLRAMQRAAYSPDPGLHYGLGKTRYSHFTSPIRRYCDLVLHQQLHALDAKSRLRSKKMTMTIAAECSKLEERNDEAYFAAVDRLKLHLLKEQNALDTPKLYEGIIVKISSQGMICDIPEYALRGFVPGRFLRTRTKRPPKQGDFIYLYLESLDFARGSAVFRPTL